MTERKKPLLSLMLCISCLLRTAGQEPFDYNCYTVIVGKNASLDGSVMIAHNEDNSGDPFMEIHKVPRLRHETGERQLFVYAMDSIDEVDKTFGYLWISESVYNAEQYVNEWGVAITSNSSRSKVTEGHGRIEHNLRRLVIERSRTAREAVKTAGALVETYGYASSGRVYSIADPNEAWVFEVAEGKHWIARRIPDDEIVLIPNYYVIDDFNKTDTLNYLSSPDIIDYAVEKGWHDPMTEPAFNFRKAWCRNDRYEAILNIARKWVILNQLSEKKYAFYDDFPFSFKPKHKISLQNLMDIMQNHYEYTEFDMHPSYNNGCPHYNTTTMRVCNHYNDYSCITQLRGWLPPDIGNVMWIAARYPCMQPYIPWYYGIDGIPAAYEKRAFPEALRDYNVKEKDFRTLYPDHACWVFADFAAKVDSSYSSEIASLKDWKTAFQHNVFTAVQDKEDVITGLYATDPDMARALLTDLTRTYAMKVLNETKDRLYQICAYPAQ